MNVSGVFFQNYRGRKITKVEVDGEFFTVFFGDGEVLKRLTLNELNHIVVTATGR